MSKLYNDEGGLEVAQQPQPDNDERRVAYLYFSTGSNPIGV